MQLTEEQFAEHLNDRLRMLMRSAEAYDQGDYAEAIRLAGSIVKIIGDRKKKCGQENKNFISLSTRLGIKPEQMVDTSLPGAMDRENLHGPLFILGFHVAGAAGFVPLLDGFQQGNLITPRLTLFEKWWNDPIIRDGGGNEFSRREIIETMRDQEDAHSDGDLDPGYAAISYKGAIGITQVNVSEYKFDINLARVVARQVAHEVLRTFVPDLQPKWIQTMGLKVQPIVLLEIHMQDRNGNLQQVTDHKAIEFKNESTSSPEVWQEWQKFVGKVVPHEGPADPQNATATVQVMFLNYAPYAIEGVQATVSMQHG